MSSSRDRKILQTPYYYSAQAAARVVLHKSMKDAVCVTGFLILFEFSPESPPCNPSKIQSILALKIVLGLFPSSKSEFHFSYNYLKF